MEASKEAVDASAKMSGPGILRRTLQILPCSGFEVFSFLKYTSAFTMESYLLSCLFSFSAIKASNLGLAATSWYSKFIFIFGCFFINLKDTIGKKPFQTFKGKL